jgi:hypothetical protein
MAEQTKNGNGGNGKAKTETAEPQQLATQTQPQQKRAMMAVALGANGMLQPANLTEAIEVAKIIAHSGLVPKHYEGNPGAVLVAIQHGAEIGLPPMASLQSIAVINGRPSLWGDAALALVTAHRECEGVAEDDLTDIAKAGAATCVVKRRGRPPVKVTFTVDMAKKAGLWGKQGPWSQYPERMLKMRARGFALRDSFPDVLRGVGVAEEVRDIRDATPEWIDDETGELRDGVHSLRAKRAEPAPEPVEAQVMPAEPTPEPVAEKRAEPVAEKPAAVMQAAPAAEPKQEQRAPAKSAQGKLGW